MGTVFLGRHVTLEIPVAVKVSKRRMEQDDEYVGRFLQEARIAAKLNHPNIVRVYDCGQHDGHCYLVMDYIDGPSCADRLETTGPFSWLEAAEIGYAIAEGLNYAGREGVIHRDIKPGNIIIAPNGEPQIVDMGLAKRIDPGSVSVTQSKTMLGTPLYMSPEQIRNPRDVDFRSDVYSLGATLYHMICGEPPFLGTSVYEVMNKHMSEQLVSPKAKMPEVPQSVCDVIAKMMAKDRNDRYQTYDDLLDDLLRVIGGEAVSVAGAEGELARTTVAAAEKVEKPKERPELLPSKVPETFHARAGWLFGLLSLSGFVLAVLVLFHGLLAGEQPILHVVAWVFVAAGALVYVVQVRLSLRPLGVLVGPEDEDPFRKATYASLEALSRALHLPVPKLYITIGRKPRCSSVGFHGGGIVMRLPQGLLDKFQPDEDEVEALLAREFGRFYYGHSTLLTLLNGPVWVLKWVVKPAVLLFGVAGAARTRGKRTVSLAFGACWVVLLLVVAAALVFAWFGGGLAAVVFLASGVLGLALARHSEYASDVFAVALVQRAKLVAGLAAKEALATPAVRTATLRCVGIVDGSSGGESSAQAGAEQPDYSASATTHFLENKWPGNLALALREFLVSRPVPALRINTLGKAPGTIPVLHKFIRRAATLYGTVVGARDTPFEHLLPEPDRMRPYVVLGLAAAAVNSVGTLVLFLAKSDSYVTFVAVVACIATALAWACVRTFRRQHGMRSDLAWSLVATTFALTWFHMVAFGLGGGERYGGLAFCLPAVFVPTFAMLSVVAAVLLRIRRAWEGGKKPGA